MAADSERAKLQLEKEDRISALPDALIQHILSLLPSTKEAIKTTVLSKRWHNQWARVPVLIFNNSGMSAENFSRFIANTLLLHDCSKLHKLHIQSDRNFKANEDPLFYSKLLFAIRKDVAELILEPMQVSESDEFKIPHFLFNHSSLIKLRMHSCRILPATSVSWEHLKVLNVEYCTSSEQALENILSGCPVLESLEIIKCYGFDEFVIASESLKKLVIQFDLDFADDDDIAVIQISCRKLEELKLLGCFGIRDNIEFNGLPSLIRATLDFYCYEWGSLAELLQQLQHVEELNFGSDFIRLLSEWEQDDDNLHSLLLNNKSLNLHNPDFVEHPSGIALALRFYSGLESLVIKEPIVKASKLSKDFWIHQFSSDCSMFLHLKTVHITGLLKKNNECKPVLDFVGFILKNAPKLDKLVIL